MKNLPNSDIKNIICLLFVLVAVAAPVLQMFKVVPVNNVPLISDSIKSIQSVSLVILGHYLQVWTGDGKKAE